ncbi:hypothetical protein GQ473_00200 [archaeon]|nr:hypothetical protein [archaeon]
MKYSESHKVNLIEVISLEKHIVRKYVDRLAICRIDGERLGWEELQEIKSEILGVDVIAIEVYPAHSKVVNLRHTRHLWYGSIITFAVLSCCVHPEFVD